MNSDETPQEHTRGAILVLSSIWFVTAAVLIWIGAVLDQGSAEAMSGLERLLFTVVSIRWFSWLMAAVFVYFGIRTLRSHPKDSE